MRAVKTVFWVVIAALLLAFAYANPDVANVHIWPGLVWSPPTWALVIGALAIGFVPTWLIHSAARWRLARRISTLEATLAAQAHALNTHTPVDHSVIPGDPGI